MNDKLHIADADLALYAMGALTDAEMAPIRAHVQICARCREQVRQDQLGLAAYAQTTPELPVPQGAKERFLSKLAATPQTSPAAAVPIASMQQRPTEVRKIVVSKPSLWQSVFGPGVWSPAIAGALAVALLAVGLDDMRKRSEMVPLIRQAQRGALDAAQLAQLMDLLTSPLAKKVALHQGPQAAPPPEGRVVYAARTGKLLLTASNLHPLPEGKVYELWILQPGGKAPLPAGTFAPDSGGYATMILADAPQGVAVQGFGVTVENAGGSQTPTLPIVLSGL
jgi:anti-sigma-K factor RskA